MTFVSFLTTCVKRVLNMKIKRVQDLSGITRCLRYDQKITLELCRLDNLFRVAK